MPASSNITPPKAVVSACKKGLDLKDEYAGKGLRPHTVEWARHLAAGKPSEVAQARRMRSFFRRHQHDKRPGWDKPPTPGYVAWLLWGGDAGQKWAEKIVADAEKDGTAKSAKTKAAVRPRTSAAGKKKTAKKKKTTKKKTTKKKTKKKTKLRSKKRSK